MQTKEQSEVKKTALSEKHQSLGAKMVDFAGFYMPLQYEGINAEHESVRNSVGVFDVSHMGEFIIKGHGALELIQLVTSNDASKLTPGKAQYSCLPNQGGGIVDDLIVYCLDASTFMLVVNASNIEKDWNWISLHNTARAEMVNISDRTSLLAVQGPKSLDTLKKLCDIDLSSIPYYHFVKGKFDGIENVVISNTGYTGAGGFELYFENQHAGKIWNDIFEAGKEFGIRPIGLGARDTLRLEMGFCLYGNDINDSTSPLEAGLGWITKFTKEFISSADLKIQKEKGVPRKLVGFEMIDKGIPRHDYEILDSAGNKIGKVTSGTMSPTLHQPIGLGYVSTGFSAEGNEIYIGIRGNLLKARVVKTPFLKK